MKRAIIALSSVVLMTVNTGIQAQTEVPALQNVYARQSISLDGD